MTVMKKYLIALFAMGIALCGLAISPATTTPAEWQTFLNATGYHLFSFQLQDSVGKPIHVQPVVIRGSHGKVESTVYITPYALRAKQTVSVGVKMLPYDSVFDLTVFSEGGFTYSSPKRDLKPVLHNNELKYSYVVRAVENTDDKIQDNIIPLVYIASFYVDENGIFRCCGDEKEILEQSPDYMIIGIKTFTP